MSNTVAFPNQLLQIPELQSKFDTKVFSDSVAVMVGDYIEALILQQIHYWIHRDFGTVIEGIRWIYKPIRELIIEAFPLLTPWKINKAIVSLVEKGFLLREHLFDKHHGHNFHPKNRTYYYTVNYEKIREVLEKLKSAETAENFRFVDDQKPVSRPTKNPFSDYPKNKTENTSTENNQRKNPHPTRPQKQGGENKPTTSQPQEISQAQTSFSKPGLDQVLARPKKTTTGLEQKAVEPGNHSARVDEKINQNKSTNRRPVQESVQNLAGQETLPPPAVQEPVRVQSKPKPKPKKTPKGTKPKKTYSKALWSTKEQLEQFRKALTLALLNGVGNARNITALVSYVINLITQGHSHIYWEEWSAGLEIGSSERHEWEAAPGQPYPKFVEYLVEKLIYPSESRSQALFRVGKILKDKTQARLYWRDFKRVIEVLRQDAEKAHAEGQQVALPVWFIERAEISVERAGESAQKVAQLAPEQTDWVEQKLPESEKLLNGAGNLSLPGVEEQELAITPDPWTDDDDDDFCFNGFIDLSYLEQQARKVAASPGQLSLLLVDFKSALSQATKNQREKIRNAIAPIYPELLNFL